MRTTHILLLIAASALAGCGSGTEAADPVTSSTSTTTASRATRTDADTAASTVYDIDAARALFVTTCGDCHRLSDAGTTGRAGPNLDTSTADAARVRRQIRDGAGVMPAGMLTGLDAAHVATYVASVSPSPGP